MYEFQRLGKDRFDIFLRASKHGRLFLYDPLTNEYEVIRLIRYSHEYIIASSILYRVC